MKPAAAQPLIVGHLKGLKNGELPKPASTPQWSLICNRIYASGTISYQIDHAAEAFKNTSQLINKELQSLCEREEPDFFATSVAERRSLNLQKQQLWAIERYSDLIQTVSRFKNPQLDP